jgi:hypothetical protein
LWSITASMISSSFSGLTMAVTSFIPASLAAPQPGCQRCWYAEAKVPGSRT